MGCISSYWFYSLIASPLHSLHCMGCISPYNNALGLIFFLNVFRHLLRVYINTRNLIYNGHSKGILYNDHIQWSFKRYYIRFIHLSTFRYAGALANVSYGASLSPLITVFGCSSIHSLRATYTYTFRTSLSSNALGHHYWQTSPQAPLTALSHINGPWHRVPSLSYPVRVLRMLFSYLLVA